MKLKLLRNVERGLFSNKVEGLNELFKKKILVNYNDLRLELLSVNIKY